MSRLTVLCLNGDLEGTKKMVEEDPDLISDPDQRSTLATLAAGRKHQQLVEYLLSLGPVELGDETLHKACEEEDEEIVFLILSHDCCDVNNQDEDEATPLHVACTSGNVNIVKALLSHNANVNAQDDACATPLHNACEEGNIEIIELLCVHKADAKLQNEEGFTPLALACKWGHTEAVKTLLSQNILEKKKTSTMAFPEYFAPNKEGDSPLLLAASKGEKEMVQTLIDYGCDVNAFNEKKILPLHGACEEKKVENVRILIQNGAMIFARTAEGSMALHLACKSGSKEIVELLLEAGAQKRINAYGKKNITPLGFACEKGFLDIVKLLIDHKGNPKKIDLMWNSGLHEAAFMGHQDVVKFLLDSGFCDVDAKNEIGKTSLFLACSKDDYEMVELFFSKNANPNIKTTGKKQITPLHLACENNSLKVLRLLLAHKANPETGDDMGLAPIHYACGKGFVEITEELIPLVGVNFRDGQNLPPIFFAIFNQEYDVVKLLLSKNADPNIAYEKSTPLQSAIELGYPQLVKILFDHGGDLGVTNELGVNGLHIVAQSGKEEILDLCFEFIKNNDKFDIDAQLTAGSTALHLAAQSADEKTVKKLLENGANPNPISSVITTPSPLVCAALAKKESSVCCLLEYGADPSAQTSTGVNALHLAAECGLIQALKDLLNRGVDIDKQMGNTHESALILAVQAKQDEATKILLESGAKVDIQNSVGTTALILAVRLDRLDYVQLLLSRGASFEIKNNENLSCLDFASANNFLEVLKELLKHGADVNQLDKNNSTLMHYCARNNDVEQAKILISFNPNLSKLDPEGLASMHYACSRGYVELMELLIEHDKNVELLDKSGMTPLFFSLFNKQFGAMELLLNHNADAKAVFDTTTLIQTAIKTNQLEMVKLLLKHGAKIGDTHFKKANGLHIAAQYAEKEVFDFVLGIFEKEDHFDIDAQSDNATALHLAAKFHDFYTIKTLVEHSASVNPNSSLASPLIHAAFGKNEEAMCFLIEHGAECDTKTPNNVSAMHFAAENGHIEAVKMLLEGGAKIDEPMGSSPSTALLLAVQSKKEEAAKTLIEYGADLDVQNENGASALIMASAFGFFHLVQALLDNGASLELKNKKNLNALHIAAQLGYLDVVQVLLGFGAEIDAKGPQNATPLLYAFQAKHKTVVKYLLEKGAEKPLGINLDEIEE